jgi:hypothetical protein
MNFKVLPIQLFDKQAKRLAKKYPSLYVKVIDTTVYLASMYDKSERSTISAQELDQIFKLMP